MCLCAIVLKCFASKGAREEALLMLVSIITIEEIYTPRRSANIARNKKPRKRKVKHGGNDLVTTIAFLK